LFSKHIRYYKKKYGITTLDNAIELLESNNNFHPKLVITFDDGYKNIFPIVKNITQNQVPVCIYLSTYYIESGDLFWWDKFRILAKTDKKFSKKLSEIEQIIRSIQQEDRDRKINELLNFYKTDSISDDLVEEDLPLSWNKILKMRKYEVDFQAHSHHHYVLTNTTLATIKRDIEKNKELIKKYLSIDCKHFSYPNGFYDEKIIKILKENKYISAVTTDYGINTKNCDLFKLYRIGISDDDWISTVAVKLSGLWNIFSFLK
jgi:peptidoglycan/xylan/chitin deacetylase (PgdA/CDA1 family)